VRGERCVYQGPRQSEPWWRRDKEEHSIKLIKLTAKQRAKVPEKVRKNVRTTDLGSKYKRKFHSNERLRQCLCEDPPIPDWAFAAIEHEYLRPKDPSKGDISYPLPEELGRADVIRMCGRATWSHEVCGWTAGPLTEDITCKKYAERWKRITAEVTQRPMYLPSLELVKTLKATFDELQIPFEFFRPTMPKSRVKRADGPGVMLVDRKNFINYNHTYQRILRAYDIFSFHHEFPTIKTASKVNALDDITEKCFDAIELPFYRTVVFDRRKFDHGRVGVTKKKRRTISDRIKGIRNRTQGGKT
jgi:hypothetical protein